MARSHKFLAWLTWGHRKGTNYNIRSRNYLSSNLAGLEANCYVVKNDADNIKTPALAHLKMKNNDTVHYVHNG